MTVVPYLGMLTHPVAFVGEFLGAVGLLFYARVKYIYTKFALAG